MKKYPLSLYLIPLPFELRFMLGQSCALPTPSWDNLVRTASSQYILALGGGILA